MLVIILSSLIYVNILCTFMDHDAYINIYEKQKSKYKIMEYLIILTDDCHVKRNHKETLLRFELLY